MTTREVKTPKKFEQCIKRIHDLLEQPGSEVTWNERISDPDNSGQPRQIDITIRCEEKLTLVECRIHREKQNVKWIEELIGRRISLRADAVIAVSATGFTEGAIKKAEAFGIILRDLVTLTEEEISSWGQLTQIWLTFFEFTEVSLIFRFLQEHLDSVTITQIEQYLHAESDAIYGIFEIASKKINENNPKRYPGKFNAKLRDEKLVINGKPVAALDFSANFTLRKQELRIPSVVAYAAPKIEPTMRDAYVEKIDLGEFEITQCSNDVFVTLDLSQIQIPPNCKFHTVEFDFQRIVTIRGFEIIGLPRMQIPLNELLLRVASA
ncbi:restriction endonuclease [Nitrosomonas sp. wSCUT-2]